MISEEALRGTLAKIEAARAAGARVVHGGGMVGRCLEATVFEDAAPSLAICAEEAFAPLVTLHRYDEFEEALALANNSIFGLQAGVFTNDLSARRARLRILEVGTVLINQVPTWRVENMPYGGVKQSGFGREGIRYAMEEMTELKSLVLNVG